MIYSSDKIEQRMVKNSLVHVVLSEFSSVLYLCFASLVLFTSYPSLAFSSSKPVSEGSFENQPIILASSSALSGPAAKLGFRLNQGSRVYFSKINKAGGINGRRVVLSSLDDGYEPFNTLKNTQIFLKNKHVFAFFNFVGTPTTSVVLPLIKKSKLPFLMPFTGADFLRNPITDNVFNLRASYFQEVKAQLDYLVKDQKLTRIGLLVQADEFGVAVEKGYVSLMKGYGIQPVVITRYRRNTDDVALALSVLKSKEVEAISFVGTYKPFVELINTAAEQKYTPFYSTVSFISSHDLFPKLKYPSRVLVTEVMPEPESCALNICKKFITDMHEAGIKDTDQIQFEGYLNAYLFVEVAKQCAKNLNQKCFLNKMKNFNFDFGGIEVNFSPQSHQGLNNIYLNFFELSNESDSEFE
jgi:ABC-type branched-subunit amino acid transport system substrate-binding protein